MAARMEPEQRFRERVRLVRPSLPSLHTHTHTHDSQTDTESSTRDTDWNDLPSTEATSTRSCWQLRYRQVFSTAFCVCSGCMRSCIRNGTDIRFNSWSLRYTRSELSCSGQTSSSTDTWLGTREWDGKHHIAIRLILDSIGPLSERILCGFSYLHSACTVRRGISSD